MKRNKQQMKMFLKEKQINQKKVEGEKNKKN